MSDTQVISKYFKKIGAKGGKERAKRYESKQLQQWGRTGGRPSRVPDWKKKRPQIIAALLERKGDRTQHELAKEIGCSDFYVSKVLKGKMPPGPKILEYLGPKTLEELGIDVAA